MAPFGFDVQMQHWAGFWNGVLAGNAERFDAATKEYARVEKANIDQASAQIDEAARLAKESLHYASTLGTAWRNAWFDSAKQAATAFAPPAAAKDAK